MKNLEAFIVLILVVGGLTFLALDAYDRSIYPGCKVLDQQGSVLIIELDDRFKETTDTICQEFGELVYSITKDGYQVKVASGHFRSLGIIDKEQARRLAKGY